MNKPQITLKIKPKELYPLISVLVSIVLIVFVIIPRFKEIDGLRKERKRVNAEYENVKKKESKLRAMSSSKAVLLANDKLLAQALPDKEEVPTLMNQIQRITQASGVVLDTLQFSGNIQGGGPGLLGTVTLQAGVSGTFDNVVRFLESLEGSSRLVTLVNINFSSGDGVVQLKVPLKAFFLSAQVDADDASLPIVLDLNSPEFGMLISELKQLRYYDTPVNVNVGIGKEDPFSAE